jgi:pantoate--beta-alanine ligase
VKHLEKLAEPIPELALVPTMGALHDGHLALIRKAKELGSKVLVSVYINPTQFDSNDDLVKYPKTLERDLVLAENAGADFVWTPSVAEIYPEGLEKVELVSAGPLGDMYEGASRPNHFSGVLTVINRLFSLTKTQFAVFGEKDYQQLFLIRKFAAERFPNISIFASETIRDEYGIALSSRNSRLSNQELEIARVLPRAQANVKKINNLIEVKATLHQIFNRERGFSLDYAEVVNPETLLPVTSAFTGRVQVLLAGWVGSVRLIDNFSHDIQGSG